MSNENETKRYYRRHRGSLFFPIILVALGILFLLQNTNVLRGDAWDTLWNLWPVILIIIGLDSLLDGHGVAGPVFFCGLGAVFLLSNFGLLAWDVWSLIFRLWPALLIAWGLDLVIGRRSVWGALAALVLMVAILGGALLLVGVGTPAASQQVRWTPESEISQVRATFAPAIGVLNIRGSSDQAALIEGDLQVLQGGSVDKETTISGNTGIFKLSLSGVNVYYPSVHNGPNWTLTILNEFPLDLRTEMAAGQVKLDLRQLKLKNLMVEVAVGQSVVYLPDGNFSARISGAVGQTVIYIPAGVSVRLVTDTGLTSVVVPADFRRNDNVYTLKGANGASQIDLDVSQALGSLIIRYDQ